MRNLFLIKNTQQLLGNGRITPSSCACINIDEFSKHVYPLEKNIPLILLKEDFDKALLERQYLDLIALLGKQIKSMYWWSSALSEKNSLTSRLFSRLYKLVCLDATLKEIDNLDIIVICSDSALIKQIRSNYKKRFIVHLPFSLLIHSYLDNFISKLKGILKQLYKAFYEYRKLLHTRDILKAKKIAIEKQNNYVVFRTWVNMRNYKSGQFKDAYFNNLPDFFAENGKNILTFAGIISDYKSIMRRFKGDKHKIIPVNFYLKGIDILHCLLGTYLRRPSIKKRTFFNNHDITFLIFDELLQDISSTTFFDSLLQYYCCLRLAEFVSLERFIFTFENYAWEKMSVLGLRKQKSNIKIIGFQHAFISRNSFKYFPGRKEEKISPLPDKIVTLGKKTQEIMKRIGNYPRDIFSLGCALRQEYLFKLTALPRNVNGGILVPLTITVEDTVKVLRFLIESGFGQCQEKVYIRFHPATPLKNVFDILGTRLPDNFIISDNPPMHEEMQRCSVVLYTWTTVCLEALKMGRPVIYLDVNYPLEVDPLFECKHLKEVCRNCAELIGKVEKLKNIDDDIFNIEFKKAQEYLDEYFMPINEENLNAFVA